MPRLYIISGPNGSGKTTASYDVLPELLDCSEFVNSDEFAKHLSPFAPESACTRGQVVTFLWRANNKPAAAGGSGFSDVPAGQYYHTAVLWAVGKGITNGTGNGLFSPDQTCTRCQIVTFLYRALK